MIGVTESPLARAAEMVGDRWSLLLVEALLAGPRRFNDLLGGIEGIASNVLSQRLKHLERDGVVVARPYSRRPVRSAYELSASGRELAGVLRLLAHWGSARFKEAEPLRHVPCGTPMEARWYCPTCAAVAEEDPAAQLRFI